MRVQALQDMKELWKLWGEFMNMIEQAQAIREAMDYAGASLDEDTALICVALYRPASGWRFLQGEMIILPYGVNSVGRPLQLYRVVQAHTSQADWTPDSVPALYTPTVSPREGYPVWSQPPGGHDAITPGTLFSTMAS